MTLPASYRIPKSEKQIQQHTRVYTKDGREYQATLNIQHDDSCGNGHNTFSMTVDVSRRGSWYSGGCQHDLVARLWPEFAHLIKWHLTSTDGPMHYLANTMYHASDKDCWRKRPGEPSGFDHVVYFGNSPIGHKKGTKFLRWLKEQDERGTHVFDIIEVEHKDETDTFGPKYSFEGFNPNNRTQGIERYECPFDTLNEAGEWVQALYGCQINFAEVPNGFSKGKKPDLEAARRSAVWPDATLEQLQDDEALKARLPGLLAEFKADIEALGLTY